MKEQAKHCVLFSTQGSMYLTWLKDDGESYGFTLVPGGVQTFGELLALAVDQPFDHYWIHSSAGLAADAEWQEYDESGWDLRLSQNKRGELKTAHGWKLPSGGQKAFDIILPHNTRWAKSNKGEPGWIVGASPKQLLMVIAYIEKATGATMAGSPSTMGWNMIRALHPKEVANVPQAKLAAMHFEFSAARDFVDKRPLYANEQGKKYLLKLDKNSAYISASTSETYGMGTPVHTTTYDAKAVGVWNVTVHAVGDFPFTCVMHRGKRWLAAPLVRMLYKADCEVEVHEGYIFQEQFMLLAKWAENVWGARDSFATDKKTWRHEKSRLMALLGMKQIAVTTVGITAYHGFKEEEDSDKQRADIKLQTVARTHELMYHNIMKAFRADGVMPIMVATDAVYILADEKDPRVVCPTYMQRQGKLGGYKYEGYIEVTPDVLALLNNDKSPVLSRLEVLNKIGWKK